MEKSFGLIIFDGKSANENCRKNRFHRKSRSATHHHVSDILRDFQRHSRDISSAAGNISESHTHLLSDDDYGQLYCPSATEDESVDLNKGRGHPNVPPTAVGGASAGAQFFEPSAYFDQDVPGPAPEIEPPRPAPSSAASGGGVGSISQFYKSTTAKLRNPEYHQMVDYDQHPLLNGGPAADFGTLDSQMMQPPNRDLNDNYNDNHIQQQFQQQQQQQMQQQQVMNHYNHLPQPQQQQPQPQRQPSQQQMGWKWPPNGVLPSNNASQQYQQQQIQQQQQQHQQQTHLMNNHFNTYLNPMAQNSYHVSIDLVIQV